MVRGKGGISGKNQGTRNISRRFMGKIEYQEKDREQRLVGRRLGKKGEYQWKIREKETSAED